MTKKTYTLKIRIEEKQGSIRMRMYSADGAFSLDAKPRILPKRDKEKRRKYIVGMLVTGVEKIKGALVLHIAADFLGDPTLSNYRLNDQEAPNGTQT